MSGQAESAVRTGNIAVLRNALLNCRTRFKSLAMTNPEWRQCAEEHVREIDIALSAPARNCDRPECATPDGASAAWRQYCFARRTMRGCNDTDDCLSCPLHWLLSKSESEVR